VRILVVAIGRLKPPFADDVQHYQRLIAGRARLELIEVKESDAVERRIPERAYVSLLHRDGHEMASEEFARWLEHRRMDGRDLCFVIGGAYGLELPHIEHRLSFGKLTLPYQLARVLLLEQP
jgi:23S rRNA (pseudouridine1915-N3)-methyltransferase